MSAFSLLNKCLDVNEREYAAANQVLSQQPRPPKRPLRRAQGFGVHLCLMHHKRRGAPFRLTAPRRAAGDSVATISGGPAGQASPHLGANRSQVHEMERLTA